MRDVTALYMSKLLSFFLYMHKEHIHEISPRINRYLKCDKWSVVTRNFTQKLSVQTIFIGVFISDVNNLN